MPTVAVVIQRPIPESCSPLALRCTQPVVSGAQVVHRGTESWHFPGPPILKETFLSQSTVWMSHSLCPISNRTWTSLVPRVSPAALTVVATRRLVWEFTMHLLRFGAAVERGCGLTHPTSHALAGFPLWSGQGESRRATEVAAHICRGLPRGQSQLGDLSGLSPSSIQIRSQCQGNCTAAPLLSVFLWGKSRYGDKGLE